MTTKSFLTPLTGVVASRVPSYAPAPSGGDDTAALQAWLNSSTSVAPKALLLLAGNYQISSSLTLPSAPGTVVRGQGRFVTKITMTTAGTPVFVFNGSGHSMKFEAFGIVFPTGAVAGATAFLYTGSTGSSWFHHTYRDIYTINAYRCWELDGTVSGLNIWDTLWDDVHLYSTKNRAWSLGGTGTPGQPINKITNSEISNTGSSVVSTDYAIYSLAGELVIQGLDFEGWYNAGIYVSGGGYLSIRGMHCENNTVNTASVSFIQVTNSCTLSVEDSDFTWTNVTSANTTQFSLVNAGTASFTALRRLKVNVLTWASTAYIDSLWYCAGSAKCVMESVVTDGRMLLPESDTHVEADGIVLEIYPDAVPGFRLGGDTPIRRGGVGFAAVPALVKTAASSTISDSDYAVTPVNGTFAFCPGNTAGTRVWLRYGGTWAAIA